MKINLFLSILLLQGSTCLAQVSYNDSVQYSHQIINIEQRLLDAIPSGDTTIWSKYLAERFFVVTEDGTLFERAAYLATFRPLPPGYIGHINVIKPKLVFYENTTVLSYVADEYLNLLGQNIHTTYGTINTYVRADTSWRIISSQVFEIPQLPPSIKVSASILKKYTGVYQLTDTITCTISLQNDTLFIQKKGRGKEALLPETESVFMRAVDTRGRKIFMLDEKGTMLMRERRNGQDVVWKRVHL